MAQVTHGKGLQVCLVDVLRSFIDSVWSDKSSWEEPHRGRRLIDPMWRRNPLSGRFLVGYVTSSMFLTLERNWSSAAKQTSTERGCIANENYQVKRIKRWGRILSKDSRKPNDRLGNLVKLWLEALEGCLLRRRGTLLHSIKLFCHIYIMYRSWAMASNHLCNI